MLSRARKSKISQVHCQIKLNKQSSRGSTMTASLLMRPTSQTPCQSLHCPKACPPHPFMAYIFGFILFSCTRYSSLSYCVVANQNRMSWRLYFDVEKVANNFWNMKFSRKVGSNVYFNRLLWSIPLIMVVMLIRVVPILLLWSYHVFTNRVRSRILFFFILQWKLKLRHCHYSHMRASFISWGAAWGLHQTNSVS